MVVDDDLAALTELHAGALEPEAFRVRPPSGGDQQLFGFNGALLAIDDHVEPVAALVAMDPLDLHAAQNLHLFIVQVAAPGGADLGLLLRCNPGSAFAPGPPDPAAVAALGQHQAR